MGAVFDLQWCVPCQPRPRFRIRMLLVLLWKTGPFSKWAELQEGVY